MYRIMISMSLQGNNKNVWLKSWETPESTQKYFFNYKRASNKIQRHKEQMEQMEIKEQNDLSPNISVTTSNVRLLNTLIKRQRLWTGLK